MIKPICSLCGKELDDFGAILLSPPDDNHKVEKYHICKLCYYLDVSLLLKIKRRINDNHTKSGYPT